MKSNKKVQNTKVVRIFKENNFAVFDFFIWVHIRATESKNRAGRKETEQKTAYTKFPDGARSSGKTARYPAKKQRAARRLPDISGTYPAGIPRQTVRQISRRMIRRHKNSKTGFTKNVISFSSGLRFRWFWSRWNRNNELYKIMQRNIIVQQYMIKPNGEMIDLSLVNRKHHIFCK